jgi:hypothetical protein
MEVAWLKPTYKKIWQQKIIECAIHTHNTWCSSLEVHFKKNTHLDYPQFKSLNGNFNLRNMGSQGWWFKKLGLNLNWDGWLLLEQCFCCKWRWCFPKNVFSQFWSPYRLPMVKNLVILHWHLMLPHLKQMS